MMESYPHSIQPMKVHNGDQKGYVHSIEVRDPFTSDWSEANMAIDSSGSSHGEVTRDNHPFKDWYYELDMSQNGGRRLRFPVPRL